MAWIATRQPLNIANLALPTASCFRPPFARIDAKSFRSLAWFCIAPLSCRCAFPRRLSKLCGCVVLLFCFEVLKHHHRHGCHRGGRHVDSIVVVVIVLVPYGYSLAADLWVLENPS
ncbi:hypothetical protein V6N11_054676 [Hibiscus sabdariffa]|uniref:Uncharacterized protein n=1 Tax=Hibiscus sabdariffa TaxID=183260 RepID=A0ABR2S4L3_9ROSI